MKILLANKFYYRRGGDCIFTMNLEKMLKSRGHEVAVFAMQYPQNESSEWSRYWPSEMTKVKAFTRPFGDGEVRRCFTRLLDDFQPDVVHLNNIHTQLSPVIAEIAHERGVRVVWTLHDSKLACPCYTCTRNGNWCEECFTDKMAVIKHRCMPGSVPGAVIGYFEMRQWNKDRLEACTDLFIPPSQFMADTCIRSGYNKEKFRAFCNFIDVNKVTNPRFEKGDYYCYLGRVTEMKGIRTLCEAAIHLPYKLKVIGEGDLLDELAAKYPKIKFLGQMDWNDFRPILEGARFMVLPSECSENNPLTVIEAQSLGTPVLGARIGGIPELINDNESCVPNGMTFASGNVEDLTMMIKKMWDAKYDYEAIAKDAVERYSSETYYSKLMAIYRNEQQ